MKLLVRRLGPLWEARSLESDLSATGEEIAFAVSNWRKLLLFHDYLDARSGLGFPGPAAQRWMDLWEAALPLDLELPALHLEIDGEEFDSVELKIRLTFS